MGCEVSYAKLPRVVSRSNQAVKREVYPLTKASLMHSTIMQVYRRGTKGMGESSWCTSSHSHLSNQFLVHVIEAANNVLVPPLHCLLVTSLCHSFVVPSLVVLPLTLVCVHEFGCRDSVVRS